MFFIYFKLEPLGMLDTEIHVVSFSLFQFVKIVLFFGHLNSFSNLMYYTIYFAPQFSLFGVVMLVGK